MSLFVDNIINYAFGLKKDAIIWLPAPAACSFFLLVGLPLFFELRGDAPCARARFLLAPRAGALPCALPSTTRFLRGAPTRGFFWFHSSAKYSRLSFDAGCTKGPGGTETRMAATRPAIGSAGSHLLCSKASDTFFSAKVPGKPSQRRPSKMTESSPPQLGLFGDPQIPENEQGHIALASAHQLLLMRSNSCVPCVTHRSRWTY